MSRAADGFGAAAYAAVVKSLLARLIHARKNRLPLGRCACHEPSVKWCARHGRPLKAPCSRLAAWPPSRSGCHGRRQPHPLPRPGRRRGGDRRVADHDSL